VVIVGTNEAKKTEEREGIGELSDKGERVKGKSCGRKGLEIGHTKEKLQSKGASCKRKAQF